MSKKLIKIAAKYEDEVMRLIAQLEQNDIEEVDNKDEKECAVQGDNGVEYEVAEIKDHKTYRGKRQYLLRFKGFRTSEWVSEDHCNCDSLVAKYWRSKGVNTVHLFCRVSSKTQAGPNHVSLDTQVKKLYEVAKEKFPDHLVQAHKISASAYKGVPKKLEDISEFSGDGDAIMIYRVDRLSRNMKKFFNFLEDLDGRNICIHSCEENIWYREDNTKFFEHILGAQKEAEMLSRRIKESIQYRKERGDECIGGLPYGWKSERVLDGAGRTLKLIKVKNEDEINLVKEIKTMSNKMCPEEIAKDLNKRGIKKRGVRWSENMVKKILM